MGLSHNRFINYLNCFEIYLRYHNLICIKKFQFLLFETRVEFKAALNCLIRDRGLKRFKPINSNVMNSFLNNLNIILTSFPK